MIDYLTIALTHVLIALTAWRLLSRDDLDRDEVGRNEVVERPQDSPGDA